MSIRSLTMLAVARDKAAPSAPAGGGGGEAAVAAPDGTVAGRPAGQPAAQGGVPQQFADVLTSAIPTEPLTAYTALIGVAVGAAEPFHPRAYLPFRWGAYGVFLGVTAAAVWVAYLRKSRGPQGPRDPVNRRSVPLAELLSALVAAGAWGLAMPGSAFNIQIGGTTRVLATASIVIGAAALLTLLFAPQLKSGTKTPGE